MFKEVCQSSPVQVVYSVWLWRNFPYEAAAARVQLCKPTSLETLDPQRAKFSSTVQTSLCPVPSPPRTSLGGLWLWRRLGCTPCRMHSFCRTAGWSTCGCSQMLLLVWRHVVELLTQPTVSSRSSFGAEQELEKPTAACALPGAAWLLHAKLSHGPRPSGVFVQVDPGSLKEVR